MIIWNEAFIKCLVELMRIIPRVYFSFVAKVETSFLFIYIFQIF